MSVDLRVDWCSYEAAKYAVEHWHYSRSMPTPPVIKLGVWENGRFIGCILFSRGANNNMLKPYGLTMMEGCELTRVALTKHETAVSKIVAVTLKKLKGGSPGLRLVVSYADPLQGHVGVIYQAMNWIYTGQGSDDTRLRLPSGELLHSRQFSVNGFRTQYGQKRRVPTHKDGEVVKIPGKHRYLYPLDKAMRQQIAPLSQPYPKRAAEVTPVDTANDQLAEGAAAATRPL